MRVLLTVGRSGTDNASTVAILGRETSFIEEWDMSGVHKVRDKNVPATDWGTEMWEDDESQQVSSMHRRFISLSMGSGI